MADPRTNLLVSIGGDLKDIKSALATLQGDLRNVKKAAEQAAPDMTGFRRGIAGVRQEITQLVGAYVGLQTVAAGIRGLFSAFDRADQIGEVARTIGISTEALSRLSFAAKFSGVELDKLKVGFTQFNKLLLKNEELITDLGIATRDQATGSFRDLDQIVLDLANVFAELPDGPERSALAMKLFGKSGADLVPVLVEGRDRLQELGEQAARTGNVITEEAAAAAAEFNDNLDILKGTVTGVANETAKQLIPALAGFAGAAADSAQQSDNAAEAGGLLAVGLKSIAGVAVIAKNVVKGLVTVVAFLADAASATARALSVDLGGGMKLLANYWQNLKDKGPVEAIRTYVQEARAFGKNELADITGLPGRIRAGLSTMSDGLADAGRDIGGALADLFQQVDTGAGKAQRRVGAIGTETQAATARARELQEIIRKLLGEDGEGDKPSATEEKVSSLRASFEKAFEAAQRLGERQQELIRERGDRVDAGLRDVETELLRATGNEAEAAFREIDDRYAKLIADLREDGNAAGEDLVNQLINVQKIEAQLAIFKQKAQTVLAELRDTENSLSAQAQAGFIGGVEAENRINDARTKALEQLQQLKAAVEAYYAATKDPSVLAYLQQLDGNLGEVKASQDEFTQGLKDNAFQSIKGFFTDLITGAKSFKDAFRDMLRAFLAGIAQMIAQKLALKAVDALTSFFGFHKGGLVGAGGASFTRSLSPMLLGAAPRYHSGGLAGLGPNEMPAILEKGEEVLTKRDPRHVGNLGKGGRRSSNRFIFVDDARRVADYMNGPDGEEATIINIGKNPGRVREILGL